VTSSEQVNPMPKIRDITRKVRILIADDQDLIRMAVRRLLEGDDRFEIIGESINGREAVWDCTALHPDAIVMNITMPEMNGLDAARLIYEMGQPCAVVILSMHKSKQLEDEARRIGVQGFVGKSDAGDQLIPAIENAEVGGSYGVL
jgi:DNA-binding NarL/FixJ family response regulator